MNRDREIKILLIALESIDNIGEELLRKSTEFLVRQSNENVKICIAQLKPYWLLVPSQYKIDYLIGRFIWIIFSWMEGNISYKVKNISYQIKYYRYFSSIIRQSDKIIFSVGMIKYSTQDFSYLFYLVNKLATKFDKPVMMSAMSPQPADNFDWRYSQLVEAINMPAVKMLTTRDGEIGVKILKSDYKRVNLYCDYVGDPALWIPEIYGVKKEERQGKVPHIGINIIRKGIFDDYNKALTDEELFNIYVQLIRLFEAKGWRWSLFTNGMKKDIAVLKELQLELNVDEEHVMPTCEDGKSYVEMISHFDVVFGARLHACIASIAVGIPVVGFVWDDKLRHFSETMKISQYFFNPKEMEVGSIFQRIEEAMRYSLDLDNRDYLKLKTLKSVRDFTNEYV